LETPLGATKRRLFVNAKVADGLDGKLPHLDFPMANMESIIAQFCAGWGVSVSLKGDDTKRPDFEKLRDLDEVWAICARLPRSWQVRIFGRFAEPGTFVAFDINSRAWLGEVFGRYSDTASKVPGEWTRVFGAVPAMTALTPEAYFRGHVRDVDQI
jgi:hypothetical protein